MGIVLDFRSPGMAWIGNEVILTRKVSFDESKDTKNNIATKGNIIQSSGTALCSNYRVKIDAVGIKNLEDLTNRNSSVTVRTLIY